MYGLRRVTFSMALRLKITERGLLSWLSNMKKYVPAVGGEKVKLYEIATG
jgi:hypothetical protein